MPKITRNIKHMLKRKIPSLRLYRLDFIDSMTGQVLYSLNHDKNFTNLNQVDENNQSYMSLQSINISLEKNELISHLY